MKDVWTLLPAGALPEVKNGDKTTVEKLFETTDDSFATTNLASPEIRRQRPTRRAVHAGRGRHIHDRQGKRQRPVRGGGFVQFRPPTTSSAFNGNRDLFLNMLNWLSSDEDLISIRPKEPTDSPLNMNAAAGELMFYSSVFGLPLLIVAFGAGVWWKRQVRRHMETKLR